jgi:HlyD family secretion protein
MMKKIFPILLLMVILSACEKKMIETKPTRKDITETIFASGSLEIEGEYRLTAKTDGYIKAIFFELGDVLKENQLVVILENEAADKNKETDTYFYKKSIKELENNSPNLEQAAQQVEINLQKLALDESQYMRYQKLLEIKSVSLLEFENIKLQYQTSLKNYTISEQNYKQQKEQAADNYHDKKLKYQLSGLSSGYNYVKTMVGGKVFKKYKEIGDYVKKGEVIALIGDDRKLYAAVNVDADNIAKIKIGQEALVLLNTNTEKKYTGKVVRIDPSFDQDAQSFICKIIFNEQIDFKVLSTQLEANIIRSKIENALLIPRNFIDFNGEVQEKGKTSKTKVKTQFVSNQYVCVLDGIGEQTVLLAEETN